MYYKIIGRKEDVMKKILKLDLTINGKEYFIGDAEATEQGFKSLTSSNWIIYSADEKALWESGCVSPDLNKEDNLELFAEISGSNEIEEAHFVMCLWEEDEETGEQNHIESCYTLAKIAALA